MTTTTLTRAESKATRLHTSRAKALVPEGKAPRAFNMKAPAEDKAIALAEDIRRKCVTAEGTAREILRRGRMARVLAKATPEDREVIARFLVDTGLVEVN